MDDFQPNNIIQTIIQTINLTFDRFGRENSSESGYIIYYTKETTPERFNNSARHWYQELTNFRLIFNVNNNSLTLGANFGVNISSGTNIGIINMSIGNKIYKNLTIENNTVIITFATFVQFSNTFKINIDKEIADIFINNKPTKIRIDVL